ncbi:hypothetical protein [Aureimonas glaciei]|uniref:Uncharacterized protein n=1 Tax=Aureimonas glaciei TaxID=1776957 RepID=A0A916Y4J4_9HYPH|nr:hypothetical protein [Aureimonas glaciei]GGD30644.1 hypothetical protein GCM10011335_37120 [Aureimonas glaciei]
MFGLSTIRLAIYAAMAAGAIAVLAFLYTNIKDKGAQDAIDTVRTENAKAGNAGENARIERRTCVGGGLRWDFVTGRCQRNP